jgi:hypothetical protein
MFESRNAEAVQKRYLQWIRIEGTGKRYLASVAIALKIYLEHHLDQVVPPQPSDEEFIYVHSTWMRNAPYLAEHEGVAYMLANVVFLYGPALQALQVAGLFAASKMAGDVGFKAFKEGALEEMRKKLRDKDIPVPAIALER